MSANQNSAALAANDISEFPDQQSSNTAKVLSSSEKNPAAIDDIEKQEDYDSTNDLDMSELNSYDFVLNEKMKLVNNALDEIGWTWYHFKLFCLTGMGYATDSQLTYIQSTVAAFTRKQFHQVFPSDSESLYAGLLAGAIIWGFSADIIGRKTAFNSSLLLSAIFTFMAGTMGNWGTYCFFVALAAAACGGNLALDATVFMEYLPSNLSWVVTFLALWWGVGQTISTTIGWGMIKYSSCDTAATAICLAEENRGWRYAYFINGAIVFFFAMLRVFVINLKETPKYLVSNGRDEEAVEILQELAAKYNRSCSLTLQQLQACGEIQDNQKNEAETSWLFKVKKHLSILFQNRKVGTSTTLICISWLLLGLAYPLYSNFLPTYLKNRGANTYAKTVSGQYRDYIFPNIAAIGGPIIAAALIKFGRPVKFFGHRGTMVFGGISTMVILFCYTKVKTRPQNIALSSLVYIFIDVYYSTLYAFTPAVLPSAARGTGNAMAIACTRTMACIVPVIGYYANPETSVPVWICGAAVGVIGCIAIFFPFDPSVHRIV